MNDRSNLRVIVFPADDIALRREVDSMVAVGERSCDPEFGPAVLQQRLRHWYRSLEVRERSVLGGYPDDPTRVWYVYRDGRIRRRNDALERLYGAIAAARATERTTEAAIARSRVIARLGGFSPDLEPTRVAALVPAGPPQRRADDSD